MKLKKVISGGQSGADKTALIEAKKIGLETGGTVPKNCRTENGSDWSLIHDYGCKESWSYDYKPRTHQNAKDGDCTIWYGNVGSPGYWCTKKGCDIAKKPFFENSTTLRLKEYCDSFECINFAGNRASKNPHVIAHVQEAFKLIAKWKEEDGND